MKTAITVLLDEDLERLLDEIAERSGRSRSDVIRDALRRQFTLPAFEKLREQVMPCAATSGYLTDEDVFREVS